MTLYIYIYTYIYIHIYIYTYIHILLASSFAFDIFDTFDTFKSIQFVFDEMMLNFVIQSCPSLHMFFK